MVVNPVYWGDIFRAVGEGNAPKGVAPLGKAPPTCFFGSASSEGGDCSATMGRPSGHPASAEETGWKHGEPHGRQQGATNLRGTLRRKPSES
jgi:hypothetical protein